MPLKNVGMCCFSFGACRLSSGKPKPIITESAPKISFIWLTTGTLPPSRRKIGFFLNTVCNAAARAHAIARVVYRMLKYQVEYEPLSVNEYEKKYKEQQLKYLTKKAAKLGFQLVPA